MWRHPSCQLHSNVVAWAPSADPGNGWFSGEQSRRNWESSEAIALARIIQTAYLMLDDARWARSATIQPTYYPGRTPNAGCEAGPYSVSQRGRLQLIYYSIITSVDTMLGQMKWVCLHTTSCSLLPLHVSPWSWLGSPSTSVGHGICTAFGLVHETLALRSSACLIIYISLITLVNDDGCETSWSCTAEFDQHNILPAPGTQDGRISLAFAVVVLSYRAAVF